MTEPLVLTVDDVYKACAGVQDFHSEFGKIFRQYENNPVNGSQAFNEREHFAEKKLIIESQNRGLYSVEFAADHLLAMTKSIDTNIAFFTLARGTLESAALALWFLDGTVDDVVRTGRFLNSRFTELNAKDKYLVASGGAAEPDKIDTLFTRAVALGYVENTNAGGDRIGIGHPGTANGNLYFPKITALIDTTLAQKDTYSILSGVAHGFVWATSVMGFEIIERKIDEATTIKVLSKEIAPKPIFYAFLKVFPAFAKSTFALWSLYGWNRDELKPLYEKAFDELWMNDDQRFWR